MPAFSGLPYWRLVSGYALYFMTLGCLLPFWPLYLQHRAYDAYTIGILVAVLTSAKIIAPNVFAWLADHNGWNRVMLLRILALAAALCFPWVMSVHASVALAALLFLFGFFWTGCLPQMEAATLQVLRAQRYAYTRVRIGGSVGFIIAVLLLGEWINRFGIATLPWIISGVLACMSVNYFLTPIHIGQQNTELSPRPLWPMVRRPAVLAFLVCSVLLQMSHGPYYAYFSLWLKENGYTPTAISQLWAVGVLAEVGLYMVMHRFIGRFRPRFILTVVMLAAGARWLIIGYGASMPMLMFLAQPLHALSFGAAHATSVLLVHSYFPGRLQSRGQALYGSLSFGVGLSLGNLGAAVIWRGWGAEATFLAAAVISVIAAAIGWRYMDRQPWPGGEEGESVIEEEPLPYTMQKAR